MINNNMNFDAQGNLLDKKAVSADAAKTFTAHVFSWMFGALLLTAAIAYVFAHSSLITFLFNPATLRPTPLYYIAVFSPIIIVLAMSYGFERMSMLVMTLLFAAYASLIGISLSTIFLAFDPVLLVKAFGMTAGVFAIMAIAGYTTKADLSRMGTILIIALIAAVIVSVINLFMHSSQLSWILDLVFLAIFTGLVAFKMQMIRQFGEQFGTSQPKMAVWMALSLYITFINLFLTLLRLFSRR